MTLIPPVGYDTSGYNEGTQLEIRIVINKGEQTMSKKTSNIFVDDGGAGSVPVVFVHSLAGNTQQ
jgi:hypothetical protein